MDVAGGPTLEHAERHAPPTASVLTASPPSCATAARPYRARAAWPRRRPPWRARPVRCPAGSVTSAPNRVTHAPA
jgi:hypothetical protein